MSVMRFWRRVFAAGWLALAATKSSPAGAAAWATRPGETLWISQLSVSGSAASFDGRGRAFAVPTYVKLEQSNYFEHGIDGRVTIVARADASVGAPSSGPIVYAIAAKEAAFGVRALVFSSGAATFSTEMTLQARSTEVDRYLFRNWTGIGAETRGIGGYSFSAFGMPAFVEGAAAVRPYGAGLVVAHFDATLGVRPAPGWLAMLQMSREAWRGPLWAGGGRASLRVQPSVVLDLSRRWAFQAGAFVTPAGQFWPLEAGVILGVWRRF